MGGGANPCSLSRKLRVSGSARYGKSAANFPPQGGNLFTFGNAEILVPTVQRLQNFGNASSVLSTA